MVLTRNTIFVPRTFIFFFAKYAIFAHFVDDKNIGNIGDVKIIDDKHVVRFKVISIWYMVRNVLLCHVVVVVKLFLSIFRADLFLKRKTHLIMHHYD